MQFRILKTSGDQRKIWASLILKLDRNLQDIHYLPDYCKIYEETYGYEAFLAFYGNEKNFIIQPFVKRELNSLPFLSENSIKQKYYDIASPYGYGGPLWLVSDFTKADLYKIFNDLFLNYCSEEKIASEFTSFHPLLKNQSVIEESGIFNLNRQKEVVYIDLTKSEQDIWAQIRKGHKSSIKKAKKNNVSIKRVDFTDENFKILNQLYYQTMKRTNATQRWIFPENYFLNNYRFLGKDRVSIFFAYLDEKVIAASIFIHDFDTVYYHFAGSDEKYFEYCANNLLLYEATLWAFHNGYKWMHLGGGVSDSKEDNLYIFKSGFSDKTATLYTYCRIHNKETYDELCDFKKKYEKESFGEEIKSDFFPLYRR